MLKIPPKSTAAVAIVLALGWPRLSGQSFNRDKLAFVVSNVFGPNGLVLDNDRHQAHFDSSFRSNFGPFNSALASQLTSGRFPQLPQVLPTPSIQPWVPMCVRPRT